MAIKKQYSDPLGAIGIHTNVMESDPEPVTTNQMFNQVEPAAKVADLLVSLGMEESFSRDHKGQGTSNRRFPFSNGMLEFLWVRDADEAVNGPGRDLRFPERAENQIASPFGVILHRTDNSSLAMPFKGWKYQPDYFDNSRAFHVDSNSSNLLEPLCFYAPFIEPCTRTIEQGTFKSISKVEIFTPAKPLSNILRAAALADRLSVDNGYEHLMVVTFDNGRCGLSKDMRPNIPLIIHW